MPSFSLFVLGSGGGPFETNLSAYLCKPHSSSWKDDILAIEAGSGVGTLAKLLDNDKNLFQYFGFSSSNGSNAVASNLISTIHTYVISHCHLDHISGLVLSAGSFLSTRRQRVAAINSVVENLEIVFSGYLWPKLANRDEAKDAQTYLLKVLDPGPYQQIFPNVSIRTMPLSHGKGPIDSTIPYESSAFFVRNDGSREELLFFGDVEPDSISLNPRTIAVWKAAAPLIPHRLSAIFLECSWPLERPDDQLFGHLSPVYVVQELEALADEILTLGQIRTEEQWKGNQNRSGVLKGLTLYITHCKNIPGVDNERSALIIAEQVKVLACQRELGIDIVAVTQGMCLEI